MRHYMASLLIQQNNVVIFALRLEKKLSFSLGSLEQGVIPYSAASRRVRLGWRYTRLHYNMPAQVNILYKLTLSSIHLMVMM